MAKQIGDKSCPSNFDKRSSDFGSFLFTYLNTTVFLSKYWLKKPGITMRILDFKGHFPDCKRTLLHVAFNMQYINKKKFQDARLLLAGA